MHRLLTSNLPSQQALSPGLLKVYAAVPSSRDQCTRLLPNCAGGLCRPYILGLDIWQMRASVPSIDSITRRTRAPVWVEEPTEVFGLVCRIYRPRARTLRFVVASPRKPSQRQSLPGPSQSELQLALPIAVPRGTSQPPLSAGAMLAGPA
ncbi:hypothetical protein B0H17DRAFT_1206459 [Mycena rosella]|uniref:Uncharacterized protein n=1 Tax=Mycena rosella TaxID=1033263 RepID=A0AAD7GBJ0_MYCRO|nr:hypothetical protein B0H17DRAFT_1206459 [Mycena rosella]